MGTILSGTLLARAMLSRPQFSSLVKAHMATGAYAAIAIPEESVFVLLVIPWPSTS